MIITQAAIDVLARTIYGEGRGESTGGKIAIGYTVVNRANKGGWWGNTVIEVCLAPKQFSCWNDADPNRSKLMSVILDDRAFADCYIAALNVLHELVADPTGGATHYHTIKAPGNTKDWPPSWAKDREYVSIGRHQFYRNIN